MARPRIKQTRPRTRRYQATRYVGLAVVLGVCTALCLLAVLGTR